MLIGDPARSDILTALMSGKALTVTELALEADVTVQTTSRHLAKSKVAELITSRKSGRHKYFTLGSDDANASLGMGRTNRWHAGGAVYGFG